MAQTMDNTTGARMGYGDQVWTVKTTKDQKKNNPCLWMEAGAVKKKYCNNFYNCTDCKYDTGMQTRVEAGKQLSWQDTMRLRDGIHRTCRHSLTQRIENRTCPYNYNCSHCDFDQLFEEVLTPKTKNTPFQVMNVKGFDVPAGYYFHNGHTWARIENGGTIKVGLDDFSLKLLGEADALDLPLMGKELNEDAVGWGLKRKDNLADILSPINGVIMEVNSKVRENPQLANREPYGDGWLFSVHTRDVKEAFDKLMADSQSVEWIGDEVNKLEGIVEEVAGPLAADGGYFQADIYGNLPGLNWNNLTKTFLKT